MKHAVTGTLFATALLLPFGSARADGPTTPEEAVVVESITALRASANVAPLVRDADLDEAALIQAEDMAAHDYVGHESPRTGNPATRARRVGARVRRVGENVVRAESPREAVEGFAASPAHRAQILASEFTHFGVAVVEDEEGFYVVEVFAARPLPELPPPSAADVAPAGRGQSGEARRAPAAEAEPDAQPAPEPAAEAAPEQIPAAPAEAATESEYHDDSYPIDAAEPIAPDSQSNGPHAQGDGYYDDSYAYPTQPAPDASGVVPAPSYPAQQYVPQQGGQSYVAPIDGYGGAVGAQVQGSGGQPGEPPTVILQMEPTPGVQGYWVQSAGRWWYYPVPAGTRAGTRLAHAPGVTGGPDPSLMQRAMPVSAVAPRAYAAPAVPMRYPHVVAPVPYARPRLFPGFFRR